jgi:diguanylate cyclase (GGDEF)-like protein
MSSQDDQLAIAILLQMDLSIFRRRGPWRYELFGRPSHTFSRFFCQGGSSEEFWTQSAMLDFFLHDVEAFFEQGKADSKADGGNGKVNSISSGIWHENGPDQEEGAFIAHALQLSGEQLIVVRTLGEEYQEKVRILQLARVNLLERRRLKVDLSEYKQKSRYDGLTGLFNRATFNDLLQENMAVSKRIGASFSLILIDIDDFKKVNDNYGHVVGDLVLSDMGQILQSVLRQDDAACRYGGEEFSILVQHAKPNQVIQMAEKIRSHVEKHQFDKLPGVTVSIGCCTYQPDETAKVFINRADLALYEAKRSGKNRVVASE